MSGFNDYLKQFGKHEQLIVKVSADVLQEVAKKLSERIREYTPVGNPALWSYPAPANYVPGTLKASWELEQGKDYAVISNAQPYAYRVETGWSTQAPEGMMRRAVLSFPDLVNKVTKEKKL